MTKQNETMKLVESGERDAEFARRLDALERSLAETDAQALSTSGLIALSNEQWGQRLKDNAARVVLLENKVARTNLAARHALVEQIEELSEALLEEVALGLKGAHMLVTTVSAVEKLTDRPWCAEKAR